MLPEEEDELPPELAGGLLLLLLALPLDEELPLPLPAISGLPPLLWLLLATFGLLLLLLLRLYAFLGLTTPPPERTWLLAAEATTADVGDVEVLTSGFKGCGGCN